MRTTRWGGALLALGLLVAACSDDDDEEATVAAQPATTTAQEGTQASPGTLAAGEATGDSDFCQLARTVFEQEDLPSAEQLRRYEELAPEEIAEPVSVAVGKLLGVTDGSPVAIFAAFGDDDVEVAIEEINAYEEEECGIPHSEDGGGGPGAGATREVEPGAARVDVPASEYAFGLPATLPAGRTSLVLRNTGEEAHFMFVARLASGVTIEEALAAEDPEGMTEGEWESGIAAPGGDEEALTLDLEPGTYAFVCWLPDAEGQPHASLGMAQQVDVA